MIGGTLDEQNSDKKLHSMGNRKSLLRISNYGRGTEQNYEKAFFCLIQSALTDNSARSLYLLGDMYLNGYYVDKDIPETIDLHFHALEVADAVDSSSETKAEIYERLGKVYLL